MSLGFKQSGIVGGGFCNVFDWFTDGRAMTGSDVGGLYRSDIGALLWSPSNAGLYSTQLLSVSCVRCSRVNTNRVYAAHGKEGQLGGLARSDDGGKTFQIVSTLPQFSGGNNGWTALERPDIGFDMPVGIPTPHPRSTGDLIALDEEHGYVYAGAFFSGVWRSQNFGASPTLIGLAGHFIRELALDPNDPNHLLVASYGSGASLATPGIYESTNARAFSPTFTRITGTGAPTTPESIAMTTNGDVVYVTSAREGIKLWDGSAWSTPIADGAAWCSAAAFVDVDSGKDVVAFGCFDPIKDDTTGQFATIKRTFDGGGTFDDPMLTAANIHTTLNDDAGDDWWLDAQQHNQMLGQTSSVAAQLRWYGDMLASAGRAGVWVSPDRGTTWWPHVKGLGLTIHRDVAVVG